MGSSNLSPCFGIYEVVPFLSSPYLFIDTRTEICLRKLRDGFGWFLISKQGRYLLLKAFGDYFFTIDTYFIKQEHHLVSKSAFFRNA